MTSGKICILCGMAHLRGGMALPKTFLWVRLCSGDRDPTGTQTSYIHELLVTNRLISYPFGFWFYEK